MYRKSLVFLIIFIYLSYLSLSCRKIMILRRDICIILYVILFVKEQYFLYFATIRIFLINHFAVIINYLDNFEIYVIIREV